MNSSEYGLEKFRQLFEMMGLSRQNRDIAVEFLFSEPENSRILEKTEPVLFSYSNSGRKAIEKAAADAIGFSIVRRRRWLRFLWAAGGISCAVFCENSSSDLGRKEVWMSELGPAAAAAITAELAARSLSLYVFGELKDLEREAPGSLAEAERHISPERTTAADALLAGICLSEGISDPQQQASLILNRTEELITLFEEYCKAEKLQMDTVLLYRNYLRQDSLPVPAPDPDAGVFLNCSDGLPAFCAAVATAAFMGRKDPRCARALAVCAAFEPKVVWDRIMNYIPFSSMSATPELLRELAAFLPNGRTYLILEFFAYHSFGASRFPVSEDTGIKDLLRFCASSLEEAVKLLPPEGLPHLCARFPCTEEERERLVLAPLKERILSMADKGFSPHTVGAPARDFLSRKEGLGHLQEELSAFQPASDNSWDFMELCGIYRDFFGPDFFFCRCFVFCVYCMKWFDEKLISRSGNYTDGLKEVTGALEKCGISQQALFSILIRLQEHSFHDRQKTVRTALKRYFSRPEKIGILAAFSGTGTAGERSAAITFLCDLSSQPDCAAACRSPLVSCAGESSKALRKRLLSAYVSHPEWKKEYLALLRSRKQAAREMALDLLENDPAEETRQALREALAAEKSRKLAARIMIALGEEAASAGTATTTSVATTASITSASSIVSTADAEALTAALLKDGRKKKVQWIFDRITPAVRKAGRPEETVSSDTIAALFLTYADREGISPSRGAAVLAETMDPADLKTLAASLLDLWIAEGAPVRSKWVLPFSAFFGGTAVTGTLMRQIRDWPEQSRGALACAAVKALTVSSDPAALSLVDSISGKFRFRQVKAAAAEAMEEAVADRTVPDLGFNAKGIRGFDYGTRQFTVRLTPGLELLVENEAGDRLKTLPAPGKHDDAEASAAAYDAFRELKKQLREAVSLQKERLESDLCTGRCRSASAWKQLFEKNPLMRALALTLIWGIYVEGKLTQAFRYLEDGSFATLEEEEFLLPEEAQIGLVHPVELEDEVIKVWKQQLSDYEVTQCIEQLERSCRNLGEGQEDNRYLVPADEKKLNDLSLSGKLLRLGWFRGPAGDGGGYDTFTREDPAFGMGAVIEISGAWLGGGMEEDVTVYDLFFCKPGKSRGLGGLCLPGPGPEDLIPLGQVPARYFSEIARQMELVTGSSVNTCDSVKADRWS